jgi:hypothetical protein
LVLAVSATAASITLPGPSAGAAAHPPGERLEHPDIYGRIPLHFEANQGQTDERVKFLARGRGYGLFLTPTESVLVLRKPEASRAPGSSTPAEVLRLKLIGANPRPVVEGRGALPGKSHYFMGKDPKKWRTDVPQYPRVEYRDVYPGVSLTYYGNQNQLEYDFVVSPGADPGRIRLGIEGADKVHLDAQGNLVLGVQGAEVVQHAPVIYQEVGKARKPVDGRFVLRGRDQVTFEVGAYKTDLPLVIDPVLVYSTYLGGDGNDGFPGLAVDASGNAYVAGRTTSTDFPADDPIRPSAGGDDVFVAKLNAEGTAVVYSTYLGGSDSELVGGIAVDPSGNAYVGGFTRSTDFPTAGAIQGALAGAQDNFLTKLDATGSVLVYSTYLGGSSGEGNLIKTSVAVDVSGNAYLTGDTVSVDFPTVNPLDSCGGFYANAFVSKVNATGSALVYSTCLGGSHYDGGHGIAADASGHAYVTGFTFSNDFPMVNPLPASLWGTTFVVKLDPSGSFIYSTPFGHFGRPSGIAADASGNAYVTGSTASPDFPTVNPIQGAIGGLQDAFLAKLNDVGSALVYSTYLGGSADEFADGIAVDAAGNAYITGLTRSSDFPTANPVQGALNGSRDIFVAKVDATGSALVYSTYLGGSGVELGWGVAVDASQNAYVTGSTDSTDFPTVNPLQGANGGGSADAFLVKIAHGPSSCPIETALRGSSEEAATLAALRRFRDDVMGQARTGKRLVRLFYGHAVEGTQLLARDRQLRVQTRAVLRRLLPTLRAVMAGRPAQPTPATVQAVEDLMGRLEAKASPTLQTTIRQLRVELRSGTFSDVLRSWTAAAEVRSGPAAR